MEPNRGGFGTGLRADGTAGGGRPFERGGRARGGGTDDMRDLRSRVETMRRGGMSAKAIRRALGLTESEAVTAGLESPVAWRQALERAPVPAEPRFSADGRRRDLQMTEVMRAVCEATGIASDRLLGRAQDRRHAGARHLLMHLLRELCAGASYPTIGFFLQRDHTTVLYGCRRARSLIEHDRQYRALYQRIRAALQG